MDAVIETAAAPPRTKRRGRHPDKALSAAFVRSAPPGRHADGNGLYLFVQPTGTRSWIQRLVIRGRRRELGLGAAALVSLAEARELALANLGGGPLGAAPGTAFELDDRLSCGYRRANPAPRRYRKGQIRIRGQVGTP